MVLRPGKPVIVPLKDESIRIKSDKGVAFLPARKLSQSSRRGRLTSPEAVKVCLGRIKKYNPDLDTPGGSRDGSAAVEAAGMSAFCMGNDLGEAIRIPSHFCIVYGFATIEYMLPRHSITTEPLCKTNGLIMDQDSVIRLPLWMWIYSNFLGKYRRKKVPFFQSVYPASFYKYMILHTQCDADTASLEEFRNDLDA